jgi:hypothetical protein
MTAEMMIARALGGALVLASEGRRPCAGSKRPTSPRGFASANLKRSEPWLA